MAEPVPTRQVLLGSGRLRVGLRMLIGAAVTITCIMLAFQHVAIGEVVDVVTQANYGWLIVAAAGQVAWLFARAERWRVLLDGRAALSDVFWAQAVGMLGTNVLPLRAGEAARVLAVSGRAGLSVGRVGTSVVLERALDLGTVLTLLVCLVPLVDIPPAAKSAGLLLGGVLVVAACGLIAVVALGDRSTQQVATIARRLPGQLGPLALKQWTEVLASLHSMRRPGTASRALIWSALVWGAVIAANWATIEAIVPGASAEEAAFFVTSVALGVTVPSSPGFIGIFQYVGQQALVIPFPWRYTASAALGIAVMSHALYYTLTTVLGIVGLARLGLSMRALSGSRPADTGDSPPSL